MSLTLQRARPTPVALAPVRRTRGGLVRGLPATGKLLAALTFVLVVVATPAGAWWAFAGYAVLIGGLLALASVPARAVAHGALVDVPFLSFAVVLPFVAGGPRVDLAGLTISQTGLIGGATLAIKATLGVLTSLALVHSTPRRGLLVALERLRLPRVMVAIAGFMVRYASVLRDDVRQLRWARLARGASDGRVRHLGAVAAGAGTLFVRSYERGERVHQAMLARGYDATMPTLIQPDRSSAGAAWRCAALPVAAALILLLTRLLGG